MKVIIVSKTRMYEDACVGGILMDTNESIRLLSSNGENQPSNTHLEVGQVWDIEITRPQHIEPPHIEDGWIQSQRYMGTQTSLRETLIWRANHMLVKGPSTDLYDGLLNFPNHGTGNAYISTNQGIPSRSTCFWQPNNTLKRVTKQNNAGELRYRYLFPIERDRILSIPFVGYGEAPEQIPSGALIRLSLARWWDGNGKHEKRCYLQLSGWYPG